MHSQFFCFLQEYRNVFFVEAAQNQSSADVHHATESTHVVEQNVAVDVGKNQVENAADVVDYLTVAKEYFLLVTPLSTALCLAFSTLHSSIS